MDNNNEIIFDLIKSVFGKPPRKHYKSKCQAAWDCPVCSEKKNKPEGDGKGNFEVNYADGVYRCWVCDETEGTRGNLYNLFKIWGNSEQLEVYQQLKPNIFKNVEQNGKIFTGLPEGFTFFVDGPKRDPQYKQAYNYLRSRGITDEIIERFKIGYTTIKKYRNRIVIPSFNEDGVCDYFTSRTYINTKPPYLNPDSPKEDIIFNSSLVDWNSDIYLVEGGLDHIVTPNSIPMLGKKISEKLWGELYEYATKNVVVALDPDAIKNAKNIYRKLDGGKLKDRIRILIYDCDDDLADLHKKLPIDEFNKLLKEYIKLKEYELGD